MHTNKHCRLCNSLSLFKLVDLPKTTIADYFSNSPVEEVNKYPIDIYYCNDCAHVQLVDVIDSKILFHDKFTYMPSKNEKLLNHFNDYIKYAKKYLKSPGGITIDIGSNDGLFLSLVKEKTNNIVLGIDPAELPANHAIKNGINTWVEFFSCDTVLKIKDQYGCVDWVSANNVFAHNDNLIGMLSNIKSIMSDDGIFTFEISYLLDIVQKGLIGTVFHEHLSYHSITSLIPFLNSVGMQLIDAVRVDSQGGALIGIVKKGIKNNISNNIGYLLQLEKKNNLDTQVGLLNFREKIRSDKEKIINIIENIMPNCRLVGFGASRSSNLLVEYYDLGDKLKCIIDDNQTKKGKYFPNYNIPIIGQEEIHEYMPNCVIILAWIHTEKLKYVINRLLPNTRILTIFPEVKLF
jgi:hypothetical protein